MPSYEGQVRRAAANDEINDRMRAAFAAAPTTLSVAEELAALREEIAGLRALLTPPSAVIITGQATVAQYLALAKS